jgi:CheY-like chemotaxis protein
MTRILVAEDSATQAVQVRGLLEEANYEVEHVGNGRDALQRLRSGPGVDLVLTDMVMPVMDGLQLVRAIRVHHSEIPVILMTSQGTDAIAIEALEDGAAGYVPKSQLGLRLADEVAQVLHVSQINRSYERLLGCLTRNEFSFQLSNDIALVDPLIDLLLQMMMGMKLCDSTGRLRVGLAIEHALLNAMYRGNLEISAEQMRTTRELLIQEPPTAGLVEQRLSQAPYCNRKIYLEARMSLEQASFSVRDEGPGFDVSKLPGQGDPDTLENEGGHGLLLMQTFMDEVTFNAQGNEVTMLKRREA